MATATKAGYHVEITFSPKDEISYSIFKKLKQNRFSNTYTNHYLAYRGPETEQAWQAAKEIERTCKLKKDAS